MEKSTEQRIQEAIHAAKGGNNQVARKLLSQIVNTEPNNARAWYLLSQVVGDDEKAIFCLEQVLRIEPGNSQALERLEKNRPEPVNAEEVTNWETDWDKDRQPERSIYASSKPLEEKGGYGTLIWLIIIIVIIFTCLCSIAGIVFSSKLGSLIKSGIEEQIKFVPKGPHLIKYRVEGSADSAQIIYYDESGKMHQKTFALPWQESFRINTDGSLVLSAQGIRGAGELTCIIYVDGQEWQRSTSNELIPMCNVLVIMGGP